MRVEDQFFTSDDLSDLQESLKQVCPYSEMTGLESGSKPFFAHHADVAVLGICL